MATLTAEEFTVKDLRELISEMVLDNSLNSFQCYNKKIFENDEDLEKGEMFISMNVAVATSYKNDKIIINDVEVSNVELWRSNIDEVTVTDEMLEVITKEITKKLEILI